MYLGAARGDYFPILDSVTRYRLVVATPSSPTRVWSDLDDAYLQNIPAAVTAASRPTSDGSRKATPRALEPAVTEAPAVTDAIVKLMVSASGGKVQQAMASR